MLNKDLRIEARSGEVMVTSLFFAVLVVVLVSMALYTSASAPEPLAAGTIWLTVAFSTVLGLSRSWQREREDGVFVSLLLTGIDRRALFLGKWLGLMVFLGLVELLVIPLSALFMNVELGRASSSLLCIVLAATPGIAASGTLFGAMTVRTRARDLVLAIVLFPLLAPVLVTATVATREALAGARPGELSDYLLLLGTFGVVYLFGGLALFQTLVDP